MTKAEFLTYLEFIRRLLLSDNGRVLSVEEWQQLHKGHRKMTDMLAWVDDAKIQLLDLRCSALCDCRSCELTNALLERLK